jgi:membrane-bound hydrogenase subunit beta
MANEDNIKQKISSKFGLADDAIKVTRARRIFMSIAYSSFRSLFEYAKSELGFEILLAITGLDEGENLSFMYHMADVTGTILSIKTSVPRANPQLKTVTDLFPGADVMEREIVDLFGAKVEGLAPGSRYPLTDDWPEGNYPLRKDWKMLEKMECEPNAKPEL